MGDTWSVYVHQNKVNGKSYVGITSQAPEDRWLNGHGYDGRLRFGRAIKKYGWDMFDHRILLTGLSEAQAKEMETKLICEMNTMDERYGYNMTAGGEGVSGFHHTDESKMKMSLAKRGEKHPNYGRHRSPETCHKIALGKMGNKYNVGRVFPQEAREHMSLAKMKPVLMCDGDNVLKTFRSAKDAQEETGINRKNISLCCLGHRPKAGGYSWKFA